MTTYSLYIYNSAKEPEDKKVLWRQSDPITGKTRLLLYGDEGWEPISSGGGGGSVDDVLVNNQSVVYGGRAYITITDSYSKEEVNNLVSQEAQTRAEEDLSISEDLSNEIQRSIIVDGILDSRIAAVESEINTNVMTSVSYTPSATGVGRTTHYKNLKTGVTTSTSEAMPIVNNIQAGIVLPDVFNTVNTNTERITNLEANTSTTLTTQPTKAALDAWTLPSGAKEGDTADVRSDETQGNASTRYKLDSGLNWVLDIVYGAPTPQATNTTLGTVKGNTNEGTVAVETDGSMSVNGWDDLKNSIPTATSQITNDSGFVTDISGKVDKIDIPSRLYCTAVDGSQAAISYRYNSTTPNIIPQRDGSGNILVNNIVTGNNAVGYNQVLAMLPNTSNFVTTTTNQTVDGNKTFSGVTVVRDPQTSSEAANKYYVDNVAANKVDKIDNTNIVYVNDDTGTPTGFSFSVLPNSNTFPIRGETGNIIVPASVPFGHNAIGASQVANTYQTKLSAFDDVVLVTTLPASPVARTLYLIPE